MKRRQIDARRVRLNFSGHATDYDRYAKVQKRVAARLVDLTLAADEGGGPVLEIGTGTGEVARLLAQRRPDWPMVISDVAHGMTCCAAQRLPHALPVDCDAQALPFREGSFKLVLSSSVFQWMNDLAAVCADCARVLIDDGLFAFALYGERTLWELRHCHRQARAESGKEATHAHTFPGEAEVEKALSAAGFSLLDLHSEDEVEHHADVPALLRSLKKIGAQNAASDRPSGLASRRVMGRMIELYGCRFGSKGAIPATYHVIYALARKKG